MCVWIIGRITRQKQALSISSAFLFSYLYNHSCIGATQFLKSGIARIMSSTRASDAERPYIEDVLDRFANRSDLTMLALGSSYWSPPPIALEMLRQIDMEAERVHRYGNILGLPALREKISTRLEKLGLDTAGMEIVITAGANQAFQSTALALCDNNDEAVILAPYYFSHKVALQLAGAKVSVASFSSDLKPDWAALEKLMAAKKPTVVVITTPNNPSGAVFTRDELRRLVALAREHDSWLVCDQTYHEFLFDSASHIFPCSKEFDYPKIVHIFSFSKAFGMPGWRVGYAVYPQLLSDSFRKIQDSIPTHAPVMSQLLALHCMTTYDHRDEELSWVAQKVESLQEVRATLWPALARMGTVKTDGAFYFLIPLPEEVSEEEAVQTLADEFHILLMPGSPFGAPGHLRLSYGSIPPAAAMRAEEQLRLGLERILDLAGERAHVAMDKAT